MAIPSASLMQSRGSGQRQMNCHRILLLHYIDNVLNKRLFWHHSLSQSTHYGWTKQSCSRWTQICYRQAAHLSPTNAARRYIRAQAAVSVIQLGGTKYTALTDTCARHIPNIVYHLMHSVRESPRAIWFLFGTGKLEYLGYNLVKVTCWSTQSFGHN